MERQLLLQLAGHDVDDLVVLGDLDIYVPCAPLNAGKIDQPYGGLAHG